MNANALVEIKVNKTVCSSLQVAENFNKLNKNIVRDIETKIINVANINFTELNFELSEYKDDSGKSNKMYFMTRDGFTLLAMSFTGKKAMEWKIKYIEAFNKMEKLLLEKQTSQWLETRSQGKLTRKSETDTIKQLIEYAKEQGSTHSDKLYVVYSKLANNSIGIKDRDNTTVMQLNNLSLIENIILNCIRESMKQNKYYKEIYKDCKKKLEQFINLSYLKIAV